MYVINIRKIICYAQYFFRGVTKNNKVNNRTDSYKDDKIINDIHERKFS